MSDRYLALMYDKLRQQARNKGLAHLLEFPPQTIMDTFVYWNRNHMG